MVDRARAISTTSAVSTRPHLAGNSIGRSRRDRDWPGAVAPQPCAHSRRSASGLPATVTGRRASEDCNGAWLSSQLSPPGAALVYKSAALRRLIFRDIVYRGDRMSAARALEIDDDDIECTVVADLLCKTYADPIGVSQSRSDTVPDYDRLGTEGDLLPSGVDGATTSSSGFELRACPSGHVPMLDDPRLVGRRTILAVTAAAKGGLKADGDVVEFRFNV